MPNLSFNQPSFREAMKFWFKLGWISFGGPTGQIAIMHQELVKRKQWIKESQFLNALNFCFLLPGPEAHQLSIYLGWLLHGIRGALAAGLGFILPSIGILWLLSYLYITQGNQLWLLSVFDALRAAVLIIVIGAIIRLSQKTLKSPLLALTAWTSFVSLLLFKISFPWVVISAALAGIIASRWFPQQLPRLSQENALITIFPSSYFKRTFIILVIGLLIWGMPLLIIGLALGRNHILFQQGFFFSKAAMVTFGGAYAVLPYVMQQAVENFHWLTTQQMIDGLALAETTPGPLVIVLQFIGFLGAWQQANNISPLLLATLGALVTSWATFVPSFLWILVGAPYAETLYQKHFFAGAIAVIAAAVVGSLANLALGFAQVTLISSQGHINFFALLVAGISFIILRRTHFRIMPVILASALLGLLKFWLSR